MRSTVNVTIVPCASASGAGSMSSVCAPSRETRAGGRWTTPVSRSFEPTNPNFHSSLRAAAVAETRCGSGRRGGSTGNMPRHARNLPYGNGAPAATCVAMERGGPVRRQRVGGTEQEHVGAVGQHDQREHLPGLGLLQQRSEKQPGLRGAGVADHRREVVDHVRRRRACRRPHAPLVGPARRPRRAATSPAVSPADSSAAFHACTPSGT